MVNKRGYPVLYNTLLPVIISTGVWLTAVGAVFYFHGDTCRGVFRGLAVIALGLVTW